MKVGDLVRYKERLRPSRSPRFLGLVLAVHENWASPSTNNVRVKWRTQRAKVLWHHASVLEVISESW